MPNAARISDYHTCPMVNPGPVPHVGGPVSTGSPDVNVGFLPASRVGDTAVCVPATDSISRGSANVFINGRPAARVGDPTVHGGVVVVGCPTVNIGDSPQTRALKNAAASGAPFCEECERLAREEKELRAPPAPNAPPVDAVALEDRSEGRSGEPVATLAKEADEGPADPARSARREAREKVAWDFFARSGLEPSSIEARVRAFDLGAPLEVMDGPAGARLQGTALGGGKLILP